MAADIELDSWFCCIILSIRWNLQNYCMHAVYWWSSFARLIREQLGASDCTCDNVADQGVPLGQIRREIHLLPIDRI